MRRTTACILAAAVYEIYPEVEYLGGGVTPVGFFYDFCFAHPIQISVIEEKVRAIIQERRPIKILEMVPFSAREYLKSREFFARAEAVLEDSTVELVQIGKYIDFCPGPHLKNTFELGAFRLQLEPLAEKVRISGTCHWSKGQHKQFLKLLANRISPEKKGEMLGFWIEDIWLKRGLEARDNLIYFLKKEWFEGALEVATLQGREEHALLSEKIVAEVYSRSRFETEILMSFFDKLPTDWNSCLQRIGKTLTILGFDHSFSCDERGGHYFVEDELSVSHSLVHVEKRDRIGVSRIDIFVCAEVETILSQMLEKHLVDGRV
ncbi:MAG: threonyl-tRNA synthetase [uncultured bacterium]|nr:MAG: threonyl-tRNA synthetase [uncultured bacterium]OGN60216.1 MAG: hypothetical protein A3D96_05225 [Chlamydiae bacterium RIFCSPHIGHO2_12_FULL_44_59]